MIAAFVFGAPHEAATAARPRLHKVIAATEKRQRDRPALPWETFDGERLAQSLDKREHEAFLFTLAQMHEFEKSAPRSLRVLANATPIDDVKTSYLAQIEDENAHDELFRRYRSVVGGSETPLHPMTKLAPHAAVMVQHDPVIGAVGVTTGIEFFAVEVLRALRERVDEPLFHAMIDHIEVDERRHQVLAVEAVAALGRARLIRPGACRARVRAGRRVVEAFFRHVTCAAYAEHGRALGLDVRQLYERSLDTIGDHFRKELPPEIAAAL